MYKSGLAFTRQRVIEESQQSITQYPMSPLAKEVFEMARDMNIVIFGHDDGDPHFFGSAK